MESLAFSDSRETSADVTSNVRPIPSGVHQNFLDEGTSARTLTEFSHLKVFAIDLACRPLLA